MNKKIKNVLRSVLNYNYHTCALSVYLVKSDRKPFMQVAKRIRKENGGNIICIAGKMILSNFFTGCNFWEYYNLKFYRRTLKNQNTFLTTYYNSVFFHRHNSYDYQEVLYDKAMFNATFSKYRNLKWIEMTRSEEDIKGFFEGVQDVIFKPRRGECGHGVFVENAQNLLARKDLTEWINMHRNYVCEEKIYNDEVLNTLNDTSLNTIRVITYLNNDHCNIIWTGIRIGKKGSVVDNISEGGSCCSIDIKTGKINSEALDEHSIPVSVLKEGTSIIGFQIPRWGEVENFIGEVARTLPQMKFVAWDIAITTKGIVLIEGNHGVSNTISQVHLGTEQEGLRPVLEKSL